MDKLEIILCYNCSINKYYIPYIMFSLVKRDIGKTYICNEGYEDKLRDIH